MTQGLVDKHPLADANRRLTEQETAIKPQDLVDVSIVFGMEITGSMPVLGLPKEKVWQFKPGFDLQDPWAQRRFESLCKTIKDEEDLKIGFGRCWLLGFRDSWMARGKDWPVRPTEDINEAIYNYANNVMTDGFQTTTYLWFDGKKVLATYIVFFLSVSKHISSGPAMEIM